MKTGDTFEDKAAFCGAVADLFVRNNREYTLPQNNKEKIKVKCSRASCQFFINARFQVDRSLRVTTACSDHSCAITEVATAKGYWVQRIAAEALRYCNTARSADVVTRAQRDHGIKVSYKQALRALSSVRSRNPDASTASYGLIAPWLHGLAQENPGSQIDLVRAEGQVMRAFVALKPWILSASACLPVVSLDAVHLTGPQGGTLFLATVLSPNRDTVVAAVGIGLIEDGDTWTWFIKNLKDTELLSFHCIQNRP